ncbi:MAG: hypothetical protein US45_C0055G0008 [Candidatus Nomurabacteria bacterium GW2011_GWA1_37_20]|uniref:TrbL/VirB6 plasmid conjugal transfer protein n=2 Tax=Parcubacteria group TaxID=1794811 RepID=A0A0G0J0E1_9BACT|nr:MAG: hypothetical protein US41_C0011G0009 [Parcubacteria group bacterium GW2011_GWB1_37_13]KKQ29914.1 MAG: hypothetical protein US45_C0055G0008 [Candidatus Nomurabacteria bacterium GW2011_GWA1_37_20]
MNSQIKKIIPYCLILVILVGLFSPMAKKVDASFANPTELCAYNYGQGNSRIATNAPCIDPTGAQQTTAVAPVVPTPDLNATPFEKELDACNILFASTWGMCVAKIFYYTYFQLPSMILYVSAQFFNAMISLGIDSALTIASGFIPAAWAVVRDLSNIFFILILLYIAIQTILGLGHETKKIIVYVIIMALLINFSMFFTKIVIDSSNILALVFYNKLDVDKDIDTGTERAEKRPKDPSRPEKEKDISGEMWRTFDATRLIGPNTITALKTITIEGKKTNEELMPTSFAIGMIFISGSIMLWAAYAFFIAGLMFIGRLIELWVLIIFSPFAFMSWTIPKFAGIEYLGWDAWLKRLISTAFMAPIFMFFIYLIFMLLPHIGKFNESSKELTILRIILGILIPSIVIMAMLLKATHFAKKGGGQFGEMALKGAKMAGGVALGAATGGAGLALSGTLGAKFAKIASDDALKAKAASGDRGAQRKLALANSFAGKSFDFRQTGVGKFIGKKTGMDFNAGTGALGLGTKTLEGGYKEQTKRKTEAEEEKFKTYKTIAVSAEQQTRAGQYKEDLNEAKRKNTVFDEKTEREFKKSYEKGEDLDKYGLFKKVESGSVSGTAKEINSERRTAYANSMDTKRELEEARGAVKTFFSDWKSGMNNAERGIVSKTAIGVATLGIAPVTVGFLKALKQALSPRATNAEVVAGIRKGPNPNKELVDELKKMTKSDHSDSEKLSDIAQKMTGEGGGTTSSSSPTH